VFGFPSREGLWLQFHEQIDYTMNDLTAQESVARNIVRFMSSRKIDILHINLSIDAFSIVSADGDLADRSCFLFMLLPFELTLKPMPIQATLHRHGSADGTIQESVNETLEICKRCSVAVHFLCSDGDPRYAAHHRAFFLEWYGLFISKGLDDTVAWFLRKEVTIPLLDLLQLMKNMWNKAPICLNPSSMVSMFDCAA
jgi:hypothetical protein